MQKPTNDDCDQRIQLYANVSERIRMKTISMSDTRFSSTLSCIIFVFTRSTVNC